MLAFQLPSLHVAHARTPEVRGDRLPLEHAQALDPHHFTNWNLKPFSFKLLGAT